MRTLLYGPCHPTREKVATPEFKAYAQSLPGSRPGHGRSLLEDYKSTYQDVVKTCIACHQEVCPGPIVKINKMLLDESGIT
ncbi:MAG: hypothetical protein R2787_16900 [Saprospiraceae bacterium]